MNRLLLTNKRNWVALYARLAIAIVIFPHGAQKLLGWFGGAGFQGTMYYMTDIVEVSWILGFLVIIVEFFGSLLLAAGLFTRYAALALAFNFIGVLLVDIGGNGFFMNWAKVEGKGEGYEYFILLFGLIIITLVTGGGKLSFDAFLFNKKRRFSNRHR
ncbi:MAG: DoxX family protein [Chitinophagaceae bacterium]|nr:DoxX family protein [Chitinophagaceae bacterium]